MAQQNIAWRGWGRESFIFPSDVGKKSESPFDKVSQLISFLFLLPYPSTTVI